MDANDPSDLQVFLDDLFVWYVDETNRGRKRRRIPSQTDFARWLGWNTSTLNSYLTGTRGQPSMQTVVHAAPKIREAGLTWYERWFEVTGHPITISLDDPKLRRIFMKLQELPAVYYDKIYGDIERYIQLQGEQD